MEQLIEIVEKRYPGKYSDYSITPDDYIGEGWLLLGFRPDGEDPGWEFVDTVEAILGGYRGWGGYQVAA